MRPPFDVSMVEFFKWNRRQNPTTQQTLMSVEGRNGMLDCVKFCLINMEGPDHGSLAKRPCPSCAPPQEED